MRVFVPRSESSYLHMFPIARVLGEKKKAKLARFSIASLVRTGIFPKPYPPVQVTQLPATSKQYTQTQHRFPSLRWVPNSAPAFQRSEWGNTRVRVSGLHGCMAITLHLHRKAAWISPHHQKHCLKKLHKTCTKNAEPNQVTLGIEIFPSLRPTLFLFPWGEGLCFSWDVALEIW